MGVTGVGGVDRLSEPARVVPAFPLVLLLLLPATVERRLKAAAEAAALMAAVDFTEIVEAWSSISSVRVNASTSTKKISINSLGKAESNNPAACITFASGTTLQELEP